MARPPREARSDAEGRSGPPEVKSAARTVELLELLAAEPRPLTLSEIASRMGLPVSSAHQLLRTLEARGWLQTTQFGGGYSLGMRALVTGMALIERDPVVRAVRPFVALLRSELEETIHFARLDGARVVYLLSRESEHQLRTVSRVGQSLPAHATGLGKAALATLPDDEIRRRLPADLEMLTPQTIGTRDELLAELDVVRRRGWALERGEVSPLSACIAVAIPIRSAEYAMSCSMPLSRLTEERMPDIADRLQAAAEGVAADLGPWGGA